MRSSISLKQETEYQPVACLDVFTVPSEYQPVACLDVFTVPSAMAITQSHPHTVTHTVTHT